MKFRTLLYVFFVAVITASLGLPASAASTVAARREINLNSDWSFHFGETPKAESVAFDASSWSHVTLPHTWNALDGQDGTHAESGAALMRGDYARGSGWYRRILKREAAWA